MVNRLLLSAIIAIAASIQTVAGNDPGTANMVSESLPVILNSTTVLSDTIPAAQPAYLRLQLEKDATTKDDIYIGFDPKAKVQYVFNEDAPFFQGTGQISFSSMSSDRVALVINRLPLPGVQRLVINLNVNANASGLYKLNMTQMANIPPLYEIWLRDIYKNDSLDMRDNKTYTFNLNSADTNSYGSKRFSLVIRQNPAMGLHLLDFTVEKVSTGAQVAWETENEQNHTTFAVERSTDGGSTFDVLGNFPSASQGTYTFQDKTPGPATNQYRLKLTDLNGTISYSRVVTLMYGNLSNGIAKTAINIYPNPASSSINLTIDPAFKANFGTVQNSGQTSTATTGSIVYSIKIVSNRGAVMQTATTSQQDWNGDVSALMPGTYMVQVVSNNNKDIIGTSKFIKL